MAEVVRLKPNQNPSTDEDYAIVARDRSGRYSAEGSVVRHSKGATFYVPYPASEGDLEAALAKAQSWAAEHGIKTIYIQE